MSLFTKSRPAEEKPSPQQPLSVTVSTEQQLEQGSPSSSPQAKKKSKGLLGPLTESELRVIISKLKKLYQYKVQQYMEAGVDPPKESTEEQYREEAIWLGEVENVSKWLRGCKPSSKSITRLDENPRDRKVTYKLLLNSLPRNTKLIKLATRVKSPHFGVTHASLQLGSFIIDWNSGSLVKPRALVGRNVQAAIDLSFTAPGTVRFPKDGSADPITKVAQIIVKWNRKRTYSQFKYNCQHFVDSVLVKGIGRKPEWPGSILNYLTALRKDNENGRPHFVRNGERIFFKNHKQLDDFVTENRATLTEDELRLLKAFDRAYLIRWEYMDRSDDECEPKDPIIQNQGRHVGCRAFGLLTIN